MDENKKSVVETFQIWGIDATGVVFAFYDGSGAEEAIARAKELAAETRAIHVATQGDRHLGSLHLLAAYVHDRSSGDVYVLDILGSSADAILRTIRIYLGSRGNAPLHEGPVGSADPVDVAAPGANGSADPGS